MIVILIPISGRDGDTVVVWVDHVVVLRCSVSRGRGLTSATSLSGNCSLPSTNRFSLLMFTTGCISNPFGNFKRYAFLLITSVIGNGPMNFAANFTDRRNSDVPTIRTSSVDSNTMSPSLNSSLRLPLSAFFFCLSFALSSLFVAAFHTSSICLCSSSTAGFGDVVTPVFNFTSIGNGISRP